MAYWSCPIKWPNETAWIIGGGHSLRDVDLSPLKERNSIAINSSIYRAPWASFLFFGDRRWYAHHRKRLPDLAGRIVTNSPSVREEGVFQMARVRANDCGISLDRSALAMLWTSTGAAMNLAVHLGARRIVLLGVDLCADHRGITHHHEPHPQEWSVNPKWRTMQIESLGYCIKPLQRLGVEVINANPLSELHHWPKRPLADCLKEFE